MLHLLRERNAEIKVFGGGGGTILPQEIEELHAYGIARIYSPDDGRSMGLEGMIEDLLRQCEIKAPSNGQAKTKSAETGSAFWQAAANWNGKAPLGELKDIR